MIGWVGRQYQGLSHPASQGGKSMEVESDELCHFHKSVQTLDGKEA